MVGEFGGEFRECVEMNYRILFKDNKDNRSICLSLGQVSFRNYKLENKY